MQNKTVKVQFGFVFRENCIAFVRTTRHGRNPDRQRRPQPGIAGHAGHMERQTGAMRRGFPFSSRGDGGATARKTIIYVDFPRVLWSTARIEFIKSYHHAQ